MYKRAIPDPTNWIKMIIASVIYLGLLITANAVIADSQAADFNENSGFSVLNIAERTYQGGNVLSIRFNSKVDTGVDLSRYIQTYSKSAGKMDGAWVSSSSGTILYFPFTQPNEEYTITVLADLPALSGEKLTQTTTATVNTRNITPAVSFLKTGFYLPYHINKGLPITSVNVNRANIDFYRIYEDRLSQFINSDYALSSERSWGATELSQYGELVYSGGFKWDSTPNKVYQHSLSLSNISPLKQPGVYLAVMRKPNEYSHFSITYFSITDIGIHARVSTNQISVRTSTLTNGKPLSNVKITLLDKEGEIKDSNTTNRDGTVIFNVYSPSDIALIIGEKDRFFTPLDLSTNALDLSDFDVNAPQQREEEIFIYAERDIFRPGDYINFNALRRTGDGQSLPDIPLKAILIRPDGVKAKEFTWYAEAEGYYHYRYHIPKNTRTGKWKLNVTGGQPQALNFYFKVEEFLPERTELIFNEGSPTMPVVSTGEPLAVSVLGRYLHGTPAREHRVSMRVSAQLALDAVEEWKNYIFGDNANTELPKSFSIADFYLDENGKSDISIRPRWDKQKAALYITLHTSLYEPGGRYISRDYPLLFWPSTAMIGIRPEFNDNQSPKDGLASFSVIKAERDGTLTPSEGLRVRLIREEKNYFWEYSSNRGWDWEWESSEYVAYRQSLDISADSPARLDVPVEFGYYRLEVYDPNNEQLVSSYRFHAGEDWYALWRRQNDSRRSATRPDGVSITLDRKAYQPGDTAKAIIVSPHPGNAMITVESERQLWQYNTYVEEGGATIEIPIDESWRKHNLYIGAVVFKKGSYSDTVTPNRAVGIIHLPLDRKDRKLEVEISSPEKLKANLKHQIDITVGGPGFDPDKKVYLSLAAVDVGVLNLTDFQTPDPFQAFYGKRGYGMDMHDMYAGVIDVNKFKIRKLNYGGDAASSILKQQLTRGGARARAEVEIVSLFTKPVSTDRHGRAGIELAIPHHDGRLRLMAVAFSENSFGSAEKDVVTYSPITTKISLPRFLAWGDKTLASLSLTNKSEKIQTINIDIANSKQLKLLSSSQQTITDLGVEQTARIPIHLDARRLKGVARLDVRVSGQDIDDFQKQYRIQIRPPYPSSTRVANAVLSADDEFAIDQPSLGWGEWVEGTHEALLSISQLPDLRPAEQLRYFLNYRYECLEQTTSKAFSLLYAPTEVLGKLSGTPAVQTPSLIDGSLNRLLTLQKRNGSFGLWDKNSDEEYWLTVHTSELLLEMQNYGYQVPEKMLAQSVSRMQDYLNYNYLIRNRGWSTDLTSYQLAVKSYAAYVLSLVNKVTLGELRTIADNLLNTKVHTALPYFHLAFALKNQGDVRLAKKLLDVAFTHSGRQRGSYLGDYGSDIRDRAEAVRLLLINNSHPNKAVEWAHRLSNDIRDKQYMSTQERRAILAAASELAQIKTEPWSVDFDQIELSGNAGRYYYFSNNEFDKKSSLRVKTGEKIIVSYALSGHRKTAPRPTPISDDRLSVFRTYYDLDGNEISPGSMDSGDQMIIGLTFNYKERLRDVLLVDLLPAGLELERQSFEVKEARSGSRRNKELLPWNRSQGFEMNYEEFLDDRYVASVSMKRAGSDLSVYYLVTAVIPGTYVYPQPYVEDMYNPSNHAIGTSASVIEIRAAKEAP